MAKKIAPKKSIFQRVTEMDLFEPVKDQNNYGARGKKKLIQGKLSANSYVPAGMTKAQYEATRSNDKKKKDANYAKNVAKGGKFQDFTDFYLDRGTDKEDSWLKKLNGGHTMAKTKYDWQGDGDLAGAFMQGSQKPKSKKFIRKKK